MKAFDRETDRLPGVIVDSLKRDFGAEVFAQMKFSDVSQSIAFKAGDLLDPLHLALADLACQDTVLHCNRMRFAAAAVDNETGGVLFTGFNARIFPLFRGYPYEAHCPYPICGRENGEVKSRTNQDYGDCVHAFRGVLIVMREKEIDLDLLKGPNPRISLYEAGFSKARDDRESHWRPWIATVEPDEPPTYTCVSCDKMLLKLGVEDVYAIKRSTPDSPPTWTRIDLRQSYPIDLGISQTGYQSVN